MREYIAERRAMRMEQGLCPECGGERDGKFRLCPSCRYKSALAQKRHRMRERR